MVLTTLAVGAAHPQARHANAGQASVTLDWDASTDPEVAGYNIYYGAASGLYTNMVSVGEVNSATITNVVPGATYYFAATAYNTVGLESDFSNEIPCTVPAGNATLTVAGGNQSRVCGSSNGTLTGTLTGVQAGDNITGTTNVLAPSVDAPPLAGLWPLACSADDNSLPADLTITSLGNGAFLISGRGIPGLTYALQFAPSLTDPARWSVLATIAADTNGSFGFIDSGRFGARFYRVVCP